MGSFGYHMQVAQVQPCVWTAIEDLFAAWKEKKVRGQGKGVLMNHHIRNLTKGDPNPQEQVKLIRDLLDGRITLDEFRKGIPTK